MREINRQTNALVRKTVVIAYVFFIAMCFASLGSDGPCVRRVATFWMLTVCEALADGYRALLWWTPSVD